ncbi:hypothetical protein CALCODRAFT_501710, partial [Calocera cornea HHB12733]
MTTLTPADYIQLCEEIIASYPHLLPTPGESFQTQWGIYFYPTRMVKAAQFLGLPKPWWAGEAPSMRLTQISLESTAKLMESMEELEAFMEEERMDNHERNLFLSAVEAKYKEDLEKDLLFEHLL